MADHIPTFDPLAPGPARAPRPGRWAGGPLRPGAPGRGVSVASSTGAAMPPLVMAQPVQQAQAQAPGPAPAAGQEDRIEGPGYPSEDLDDLEDGEEPEAPEDDEFADRSDIDDDIEATAPPELGAQPIEAEDGDTSIVGDGHAEKAAWNRERIAAMQETETEHRGEDTFGSQEVLGHGHTPDTGRIGLDDPAQIRASAEGRRPGSSEDMGYGGGAPNEDVTPGMPGRDTGDGRLDELAEDTERAEEDHVEDAADALDNPTRSARGGSGRMGLERRGGDSQRPVLPEAREAPDEGVAAEERLLADDDEDAMFGDAEMGEDDDLEMERLNEQDDIAADFEDQRDADDAMDGNEERTWRRD